MDGKAVAQKIKNKIAFKVQQRLRKGKRAPGLAVILVGNDSSSKIYVANKQKVCKDIGFISMYYTFPSTVTTTELVTLISVLNANSDIDGILIQLPLPVDIDNLTILEHILPDKDIDGFHPYNIGRLCQRAPLLRPCTPHGIMTLLKYYNINTVSLNAVVVGTSNIVGRPMSLELLLVGCTVIITNRLTRNLKQHIENADLLIVAVGTPRFIPGAWIKPGAVVIDVGINRLENGKIVGDVDYDGAIQRASYITPVPGGIGPMTIAMLIQNTLQACENYHDTVVSPPSILT